MIERVGKKIMRIQRQGQDILNISNRGRLVYTQGDTTPQMVLVCKIDGNRRLVLSTNIERHSNYEFVIDWGDGSELVQWGLDSHGVLDHKYAAEGEYRVTITGIIDWREASESNYRDTGLPIRLRRIELPTGVSPIRGKTSRAFRNFIYLENIPAGLYNHIPYETDFSYDFYKCNIKEIPPNLFKLCRKAKYFSYTFAGTNIEAIPENLFKNLNPMYLDGCFSNCNKITGKLPELWNKAITTNKYEGCYYGCLNATNYAEAIAAGWA